MWYVVCVVQKTLNYVIRYARNKFGENKFKGNDDRQIKYVANRQQINTDSTIYVPSRILSATYSCEAQIPPMAVRVAKLIKDCGM